MKHQTSKESSCQSFKPLNSQSMSGLEFSVLTHQPTLSWVKQIEFTVYMHTCNLHHRFEDVQYITVYMCTVAIHMTHVNYRCTQVKYRCTNVHYYCTHINFYAGNLHIKTGGTKASAKDGGITFENAQLGENFMMSHDISTIYIKVVVQSCGMKKTFNIFCMKALYF